MSFEMEKIEKKMLCSDPITQYYIIIVKIYSPNVMKTNQDIGLILFVIYCCCQ